MNKVECGLFCIDETNKLGFDIDFDEEDIVLLIEMGEILFVLIDDVDTIRVWIEVGMFMGSVFSELLVCLKNTNCFFNCDNVVCGEFNGCGGVCCDNI